MITNENNEVEDAGGNANRVSIGEQLYAARTKQKLTSEKVARELNLSEPVIKAIESDDAAALPAPIYVQGYVRSYARLLDLPEDDLVRDYSRQYYKPPPLSVSHRTRRLPLLRLPSVKLIRNVILALLAVILLWMAYPFVARLIEMRDTPVEQQAPGRLELPPAEQSVNPD